ncbi:hypothetical protein GLYMA_15G119150v4 [Glycine max]|nr:hypothetical protein GLYMA_15G119150v4 [Glycine max]KAH1146742.1 hypothetical protein GYH30_042097 [Glycine max]
MGSKGVASVALILLSLNLLFFSMVSSSTPPRVAPPSMCAPVRRPPPPPPRQPPPLPPPLVSPLLFLIKELFKIFVCFLYHLMLMIFFFQEAPSKLAEHQLGEGIGRHLELHPPGKRAIVIAHQAAEMLVGTEDLDHDLHR